MGTLKRDKIPSISQLEKQLKKYEYRDEYTGFSVFWRKYQNSGGRKKVESIVVWPRQIGLAAVSLAAVLLVVFGISRLFWTGYETATFSWNKITGNGGQISVDNGNRWKAVDKNTRLAIGSKLKTDNKSEAVFSVHGSIHLKVFPGTEIKIGKMSHKMSSVELSSGKLAYVSGKLKKGQTVSVATPLLNVLVTGTSFLVSVDSDKNVKVSVVEGEVRIAPLGQLFNDQKLSGNGFRRLAEKVLEKSFFPVSQTVVLKAKDEEEFYKRSQDLIRQNAVDINKGNIVPSAEKITALFRDLAEKKAYFTSTAETDREGTSALKADKQSGKIVFRVAAETKMPVTGRESEILELPGGRQCFTVDQSIVFMTASDGIEKTIPVGSTKQILTRPQIAGDMIVMGSDKGGLYAFNFQGSAVWTKKDAGIQVLNAFPLSCGSKIVVSTVNNGLRFFDWSGKSIPTLLDGRNEGLFYSPMTLMGGTSVLFGNEKGYFTVFNVDKNMILWSKNIIQDVSVYALTGDDRVAIIQSRRSGTTVAVRPADGSVIWKEIFGGTARTRVSPSVENNRIAFSGDENLIVADLLTGKTISSKKFLSRIVSMKWFRGSVLVGDESGGLYRYDMASGKAEMVYSAKGPVNRISVRENTVTFFTGTALVRLRAEDLES